MKLLSSACNDTEEVIYNPGSWNEHYTSETWLCTKETVLMITFYLSSFYFDYIMSVWQSILSNLSEKI